MLKSKRLIFLALMLVLLVVGQNDDDDDKGMKKKCLVEAVGAHFPFAVSTYWNHECMKPYLNRCDANACSWSSKYNKPG